jgi:flagellar motility protein MotE (MotC chaperone)
MVDEAKQDKQPEATEAQEAPVKAKSGLLKYIVVGGAAFVFVIVVSIVTLVLVKPQDQPVTDSYTTDSESASAEHSSSGKADGTKSKDTSDEIDIESLSDETVLAEILANLEFLDYKPTDEEISAEEGQLSVEDSVEQVNWIDKEKKRLADKESELNKREAELTKLDKQVSRKLVELDQAESTRITNLAKLYDGMDTKAVAKLVANLDDATVVSILPRMNRKNASALLEKMPSKRAARLSQQLITIAEN